MLGYSGDELVGKHLHTAVHFHHADGSPYPVETCPVFLTGQDGMIRTVSDEVLWRKDGAAVEVEYTVSAVVKNGQTTGTVMVFRDIAERKLWPKYMNAYEEMIRGTSRPHAPWYVVPAVSKPFARLVVARALVDALARLKLEFPKIL